MSAEIVRLSDYRRPQLRAVEPSFSYFEADEEFVAAMQELARSQEVVVRHMIELWALGVIKWPS